MKYTTTGFEHCDVRPGDIVVALIPNTGLPEITRAVGVVTAVFRDAEPPVAIVKSAFVGVTAPYGTTSFSFENTAAIEAMSLTPVILVGPQQVPPPK